MTQMSEDAVKTNLLGRRRRRESAHVRVDSAALQRLRYAIVATGGNMHGSLKREASEAIEARVEEMLRGAMTAAGGKGGGRS